MNTDPKVAEAISLLESASVALWRAGNNPLAREIDRFLDVVSPDSRAATDAALSTPAGRAAITPTEKIDG